MIGTMWTLVEKCINWMNGNRVVVLLLLVLVVNLFSIGFFVPSSTTKSVASAEPILKLSEINGPRISDVAAMTVVEGGAFCRDLLLVAVWVFLLIVFVALLIFNLSYNFEGSTKVQWFWEALLALTFLSFWFFWDTCHTNLWFPLFIIQIGITIFAVYLYFFEQKLLKEREELSRLF